MTARHESDTQTRPPASGSAPTRATRLRRARRTRSGLPRGPTRARADSGRAAGRGPRARSLPGRPRAGAPPRALPPSTGTHRRAPSARAAGRTQAPRPRRRRAVQRAVGQSTTPPRGLPARLPSRALSLESSPLDLHYYRKDHRPAVGSVVGQVARLGVEVFLEEAGLPYLLAQALLQDAVGLVAELVEQRVGVVAEPAGDQLGRPGAAAVRRGERRDDDQDAVLREAAPVAQGDVL